LLLVTHRFPNGQKIVFGGTHLCHEYAKNQQAQAEAICDFLKKEKVPVMVVGDFNITDDSNPYATIAGSFIDVAVQYGNPQNTIPADNPTERIDYIFVSKADQWVIKKVQVIDSDASDHLPVLVTLKLKNK
jgi:Metal-dependent hydrolase